MSRIRFDPQSAVYPMPVFVIGTWNEDGSADAMTAAWGGIYDTNKIGICLSSDHRTVKNLLARRAFTVSPATVDTEAVADYVGMVSANDTADKIAHAGLHAAPSRVDAPLFDELPMALECRLVSRDEESGWTVDEIVGISADEKVLGPDGKIDATLLRPIVFDPVANEYRVLGKSVGKAFHDGLALK